MSADARGATALADARTRAVHERPQGVCLAALRAAATWPSCGSILGSSLVIWLIFQVPGDHFLTAVNLTNLVLQITAVGMISVGVVLVLLLGEIDLSVGAVSGLAPPIMAVLNVKHGWTRYPAIAAGVVAGARDRALPGLPVHALRGPVVRRHAGRPAGLAGRAALRARRHRHGQHHRHHDHRPDRHVLLRHGRLDHRGGRHRGLRAGQPGERAGAESRRGCRATPIGARRASASAWWRRRSSRRSRC